MIAILEATASAAAVLLEPSSIGLIIVGLAVGLVFGLLPGLAGVTGMALMMPFTFGMDPLHAMVIYAAIMGSVTQGGAISAILLNAPGTAHNAASCLDGYPMSQRGEGAKAVAIAEIASAFGGIFGYIILLLLLPFVRQAVLLFSPPEYFMLILFGLASVAFAATGSMVKGLAAGGVGILLSFIGYTDLSGIERFVLGCIYLWDGIQLVPFFVGVFAFSELINYMVKGGAIVSGTVVHSQIKLVSAIKAGFKEVFSHTGTFFRSSAIGVIIGIIPGVGATVAHFLAYTATVQTSKHPETFGTGDPEGLVSSESANNSVSGGALLPTVAFGIPGGAEMAVLLGVFTLHGLAVGPLLVIEHLDIVMMLVLAVVASGIIASSIGLLAASSLARLTFIRVAYIIPVMLVVCTLGVFSVRGNFWDVVVMVVLGLIGYGMTRFGFSKLCFVIGFILGHLAEKSFHQSLQMSYGSYAIFFTRPISLILFLGLIAMVTFPLFRGLKKR